MQQGFATAACASGCRRPRMLTGRPGSWSSRCPIRRNSTSSLCERTKQRTECEESFLRLLSLPVALLHRLRWSANLPAPSGGSPAICRLAQRRRRTPSCSPSSSPPASNHVWVCAVVVVRLGCVSPTGGEVDPRVAGWRRRNFEVFVVVLGSEDARLRLGRIDGSEVVYERFRVAEELRNRVLLVRPSDPLLLSACRF